MMVDVPDDAVAQVLEQYHPFVRHIAKRACHSSSALDINDLYQVGDMAVLRAVRAYDPSSGRNIKSFVTNSIRNAIFNEAARFLGVLTVDFRTTNLASMASKMHEKGKSDEEIATALTEKYGRNFDAAHARDLRITYNRRHYSQVQEDLAMEGIENDLSIKDLLDSVVKDEADRIILDRRIFGGCSIEQIVAILHISRKAVSKKEACLKTRIKRALEDAA
jgi:RNA polymerase sigma factor (sigma-70 family)